MGNKIHKVEALKYPRGNEYTGSMKGNKRHGYGTFTWADDGCYYTGQWENDMMTGDGKMTFKNGFIYEGKFFQNNIHGVGTLTTVSGEKIKGAFIFKRRFITTDGPKYPVAEYQLDVDIIATDGRKHMYKGNATLHLYTGLLVLPNMKNPNPQVSVYESAILIEPVDPKADMSGVAVVEAVPVQEDTVSIQPNGQPVQGAGVQYGVQDQSYQKEVRRVNKPGFRLF